MPRLDGFSWLRAIRNDPEGSNLPVILLSARAGQGTNLAYPGFTAGFFRAVAGETASQERIDKVREILERAMRDLDGMRDKP